MRGLRLKIGDALAIQSSDAVRQAEVIALTPEGARVLPYGDVSGIGKGDVVTRDAVGLSMFMSEELIGRVVDGLGRPIDGGPPLGGDPTDVDAPAPSTLFALPEKGNVSASSAVAAWASRHCSA